MSMFILAHLTDPHLPTPGGQQAAAFANKRLVGLMSWRLRRRHIYRPELLATVVRDLQAQRPDHIAVTGDIVNIALPDEFAAAAAWLGALGTPEGVSVVPGNHDAYVRVAAASSLARWEAYMRGDDPAPADGFPFLRRRNGVALIGLTTAEPSPPGMAWGSLGNRQLERLGRILAEARSAGDFRIVLLHHRPIDEGLARHKRLRDAAAFREVIAREGAELVLHGHTHRFEVGFLTAGGRDIPVVGAPSASAATDAADHTAQYHLYRIAAVEGGWSLDMRARRCALAGGSLTEHPIRSLFMPAPAADTGSTG
ncbi:MAG: metallophosphoesterase [Defluviicoccus sp.]|nr:metallophosphoesterase [Defluviicoccus sp.]